MNETIFNKEEMEEKIADYLFGRLEPKEKEKFEHSLQNYPELVQEINDVREVFRKLDALDLDNYLDRRTRNLPVKVSAKFQQKSNPLNIFAWPGFVSLVAGVGIVLIAISLFFTKINKRVPVSQKETVLEIVNDKNQPIFPQLAEVDSLAEKEKLDITELPELSDYYLFDNITTSFDPASDFLDEIITEQLVEFLPNDTKLTKNILDYRFYDNLNNLDENDFQQLIEELKSVKI